MILLIDDQRNLKADIVARNGETGIAILTAFKIDALLLDHDLGEGMNGYDVVCFLEERTNLLPNTVELVTSNPVGRARMAQVLSKLYPYSMGGTIFSKEPIKPKENPFG